jgi:hypothetical protein
LITTGISRRIPSLAITAFASLPERRTKPLLYELQLGSCNLQYYLLDKRILARMRRDPTYLLRKGNYVDDWLGYANEFDELLNNFADFLAVCLEYNITLNTSKTMFGFSHAQFFGFRVDRTGTRLADK